MSQELNIQERLAMSQNVVREIALSLGYSEADLDSIQKRLEDGEPLYTLVHIPENVMGERYQQAKKFYDTGELAHAETLFRWLCLFNGTSTAHWMGLGGCLQGQKRWEEALTAYALAVAWSQEGDPKPLYHVGLCQYMLGHKEESKQALEECVVQANSTAPDVRELVRRACTILASLESEA